MKKLFVLFLLVALVPFTVGCGLFGDNDDTSPIDMATLTASVGGLTPSIRAALSNFAGYKIKIGDVTLEAYDEVVDNAPAIPATYKVMFRAFVAPSVVSALAGTTAKVEIYAPNASAPSSTVYIPMTALTTTSEIGFTVVGGQLSSTAVFTPTTGAPVTVTGGTSVPVTATVTYNNAAVSVSSGAPTVLVTGNNKFTVELPTGKTFKTTNIGENGITYRVKAKNVLGTEIVLDSGNFNVVMLTNAKAEITFTEAGNETLKAGQTYQVAVDYVSDGETVVNPAKFYIKK